MMFLNYDNQLCRHMRLKFIFYYSTLVTSQRHQTQERQPEEARAGAHGGKEVQVCTVHTRQVVQG